MGLFESLLLVYKMIEAYSIWNVESDFDDNELSVKFTWPLDSSLWMYVEIIYYNVHF